MEKTIASADSAAGLLNISAWNAWTIKKAHTDTLNSCILFADLLF